MARPALRSCPLPSCLYSPAPAPFLLPQPSNHTIPSSPFLHPRPSIPIPPTPFPSLHPHPVAHPCTLPTSCTPEPHNNPPQSLLEKGSAGTSKAARDLPPHDKSDGTWGHGAEQTPVLGGGGMGQDDTTDTPCYPAALQPHQRAAPRPPQPTCSHVVLRAGLSADSPRWSGDRSCHRGHHQHGHLSCFPVSQG